MGDRLKGKRAFVTAGAAGIGRASAIAFAREGATVFATDIDEKGLAALAKEGVSEVARLDMRDSAAVTEMAKRAGPVDILLNAAGFVHHGTVLECSDQDWDFSFDLNVKSMHRTLRAFLPGMLERGRGSIVNISSAAGVFKAAPNRYVYGATKAAVAALTRAVAADFITKGIRCNCICHRDAVDAEPRRRRRARGARDVREPPADGKARHRGGNRLARRLSRQRRERVYDRRRAYHRWRLDAITLSSPRSFAGRGRKRSFRVRSEAPCSTHPRHLRTEEPLTPTLSPRRAGRGSRLRRNTIANRSKGIRP
jgi:2-keto-3-deoxy-L-fuconate dehydrogenase